MKKAFVISLLLVSIFLIGSAGVAWAPPPPCMDYQEYQCSVIGTQYGEVDFVDTDCVALCYDGFEADIYSPFFYGYLYPATGSKNLLGTAYDYSYGWTGCSVERNGRSITVKVSYIQEDDGYVVIHTCTPCDNCCG
jgi:hypothetical protein